MTFVISVDNVEVTYEDGDFYCEDEDILHQMDLLVDLYDIQTGYEPQYEEGLLRFIHTQVPGIRIIEAPEPEEFEEGAVY